MTRRLPRQVRALGLTKAAWLFAAGILVALVLSRPVLAADVSGQWEVTCQLLQGPQPFALDVVQAGGSVSGTAVFQTPGGEVATAAILGTATRGGDFRLGVVDRSRQPPGTAVLTGTVFRDHVSGELEGALGGCVFHGDRVHEGSPAGG